MFDDFFNSANFSNNKDAIVSTYIKNTNKNKTINIISGEYKDLNGKKIFPGESLNITLRIPSGYREFINNPIIMNNNLYMYVGYIDEDARDPLIYQPN